MDSLENTKLVTSEDLVRAHEQEVAKSLQKLGLSKRPSVHFPGKRNPPLLGRLGVWLVNKTGGIIVTKYQYVGVTIKSKQSNSRRKK